MARTVCKKLFYAELDSFITGFHVYKEKWLPDDGQILIAEKQPDNKYDPYAVAVKKEGVVIGHLPRDERHVIFFFLQTDYTAKCIATITGNPVNLGDKLGQKVPCRLRLSGRKEYIEVLKGNIECCQ